MTLTQYDSRLRAVTCPSSIRDPSSRIRPKEDSRTVLGELKPPGVYDVYCLFEKCQKFRVIKSRCNQELTVDQTRTRRNRRIEKLSHSQGIQEVHGTL